MTGYVLMQSFFLIFALVGFFTFLNCIVNFFLLYGKNNAEDISLVCRIKKSDPKTEYILRSLKSYTEGITTKRGEPFIYVIDDDMDRETFLTVSGFCAENENMAVLKKNEFLYHMEKIL